MQRLKARRPEIAIGADLIAGFPTESEAMHANSVRLVEQCDIVMGHVFPFSPKKGTPAARMPAVAPGVVKERARRLREACAERKSAWLAGLVGSTQRVLVERADGLGHAENFAPVTVRHPSECRDPSGSGAGLGVGLDPSMRWGDELVGKIVSVTISAVEGEMLVGVPV